MKFNFNKAYRERDTIIFNEYNENAYLGGIRKFKNLSPARVKKLIDLKFLNPKETYNDAPSAEEFLIFMNTYKGYTAHGYVVTPDRDDYRVTIEGIAKNGPAESDKELHEFTKTFRYASEFETNGKMFCWFD